MDQHARSVRLTLLWSARSMALSAMVVESKWFVYLLWMVWLVVTLQVYRQQRLRLLALILRHGRRALSPTPSVTMVSWWVGCQKPKKDQLFLKFCERWRTGMPIIFDKVVLRVATDCFITNSVALVSEYDVQIVPPTCTRVYSEVGMDQAHGRTITCNFVKDQTRAHILRWFTHSNGCK